MQITRSGNLYSFHFATVAEVTTYNDWLNAIGLDHARVTLPLGVPSRTLRRVLTKSPSILAAQDDAAVEVIHDRWGVK